MYPILHLSCGETGINALTGVRHSHDYSFEILHILSGSGSIMIKDKLYPIEKQTVYLIPLPEVHSVVPDDDTYARNVLNFSLSDGALHDFSDLVNDLFARRCLRLRLKEHEKLCEIFDRLRTADAQNDSFHTIFHLMEILNLLFDAEHSEPGVVLYPISQAISYIHKHLEERLSLDELCRQIPMSKYYFCRLFKQSTGMSPYQYITECKISQAKKWLRGSTMSVSEIAEKLGYDSLSSFGSCFKKIEGTTPTQFRKQ